MENIFTDIPTRGEMFSKSFENINKLSEDAIQERLKEIEAKYAEPKAQAELAHTQAQIPLIQAQTARENMLTQNPYLSMSGDAGQIGALMALQKSNPQMAGLLMQQMQNKQQAQNARSQYYMTQVQGKEFAQLPVDAKTQLIAQAAGMGITPDQASHEFLSGKSLAQMATDKGFDPNQMPEPIYPATKTSITQIQRRQQALAEINSLENRINEGIAPYSRTIHGFSPKQVYDAIKNDDVDKQARFLAARGLQPELAATRTRMLGGQVGIETIRHLTDAALGNVRIYQSLVSPDVFIKAQEYMNQWLNDAALKANKITLQPTQYKEEQEQQKTEQQSGQTVTKKSFYDPTTGEWRTG